LGLGLHKAGSGRGPSLINLAFAGLQNAESRLAGTSGAGSGGSTPYERRDGLGAGNPRDEVAPPGSVPMDRDFVRIYDPRRTEVGSRDVKVTGRMGDAGKIYSMETRGEPDRPGETSVPYYDVFSTYSRQAEKAIEKEKVPAAYRQRVKAYFDALKEGSTTSDRAEGSGVSR